MRRTTYHGGFMHPRRLVAGLALAAIALAASVAPAHAQGKGKEKHYAVSGDRAVSVTRTVLVRQGYDVVRVERVGATQVVYYRAGNRGRGKGKGPVQKMVIRTVERRIVFENTPPAIMVDIDVDLKL
jgi:hypothetical protein